MKQIKTFTAVNADSLDRKVNEWIRENHDPDVFSIEQIIPQTIFSSIPQRQTPIFSVTVVYNKIKKYTVEELAAFK